MKHVFFAVVAIFMTVQASLGNPDHKNLLKRQIPGTFPSECNPACAAIISIISPCAGNVVECACTPAAGAAEEACLDCISAVDSSIPAQAALDAFSSICSNARLPFNPPLSLSPSAPASSPSGPVNSPTAPASSLLGNSAISTAAPTLSSQLAPYTQSFAPSPTQGSGAINVTVNANDPRITTSGPDWNTTASSCDSSNPCKKCSVSGEKLTFKFSGKGVFMSSAQSDTSGQYSVVIDNSSPVVVDGFANSQNAKCTFGWSAFGLKDTNHTIIVTTLGQSPKASADGKQAATFELDGFVITQSSTSSKAAPLVIAEYTLFHFLVVLAYTVFPIILVY